MGIADKFSFLKLPPTLDDESRHFIGTIIISELQHAIMSRKDTSRTFCLYVDEFQHFATDEFAKFITEGRKYGCAITLAHQERIGQFGANEKVLGATMACANKVIFQCTVKDARELAPEFAEKPTVTETRKIPELVISKEPLWDLLKQGHPNERIMELFRKYLLINFDMLTERKNQVENLNLERSGYFDEAMLARDLASLSGIDEKRENRFASLARGRDITISNSSLDRTEGILQQAMQKHESASNVLLHLRILLQSLQGGRIAIQTLDQLLTAVMEGRLPIVSGNEDYADLIRRLAFSWWHTERPQRIPGLYVELTYGDPTKSREIDSRFALRHWPRLVEETWIESKAEFYKDDPIIKWEEKKQQLVKDFYARIAADRWTGEADLKGVVQNIPAVRKLCSDELLQHNGQQIFTKIDECIEFIHLLALPENHIKVPSGVYKEVAVNMASTQEMVNRAVQELTELPRFTAMAKILLEENGKQSVKKATIKLQPPPKRRQTAAFAIEIADFANGTIGRYRDEIAKQIVERAAPFEEGKRGKQQQQKSSPKKGHSDPPDQPESPPQGWVC